MSYRPQTSSRRNTGRARGRAHHEKAKRKEQKHHSGKYLFEEGEAPTFEEEVEKILGRLGSLGGQVFAFSPFSQYYDDWLLSLKSVLSEFESNPAVNVDEVFVKERSQIIADIERKLGEVRSEEAELEKVTRKLSEQNHLLVQSDTEYAHDAHNLASRRDSEIKRLTRRVHDYEEELEVTNELKAGVFSPFARRAKSQKTAEVTKKLDAAKTELESAVKQFEVEQEKLHDGYEKKKQAVIKQVQGLEKEIEDMDFDGSVEDRKFACEELGNAVKSLLQRKKEASP
jgi:DNA repair exonuclease SbcCD ATPase subunit